MNEKTAILYELNEKEIDENGIAKLTIKHLEPENQKTFSLKEMQKAVGGYIEIAGNISIDDRIYIIVVDEEGKLKNKPTNFGFWWNYGSTLQPRKHKYVGNVLLIPERTME